MHLTLKVKNAISKSLPDRFALLIDGWTHHSTHFLAVLASFMENSEPNSVLSFLPLMCETVLNATEHVTFLETVLEIFGRTRADNCELNKTFCYILMKPLIDCASHRFALAVQDYIKGNQSVINKIQQLMVELRRVKLSAKLRQYTNLRHVLFNATGWSSVFEMISRYREFISILQEEMQAEANIVDISLSPKENSEVDCFSELKDSNSCCAAKGKTKYVHCAIAY